MRQIYSTCIAIIMSYRNNKGKHLYNSLCDSRKLEEITLSCTFNDLNVGRWLVAKKVK